MTESRPAAWQEIAGRRIPVEVAFRLEGGQIGFRVAHYDRGRDLVIDPTYQWHTFFGAADTDSGQSLAVDSHGNVYVTGTSAAPWNGPGGTAPLHADSSGPNQWEIFLLKLNTSGAYQWHTFFGSASPGSPEFSYGLGVDGNGNVYVTGTSGATWNGPGGTPPLHAYSGSGTADIVVLKLNTSGAYQWHTFFGPISHGSGGGISDGRLAVDDNDNVYVTGTSDATWNGPGGTPPLHAYSGSANAQIVVLKLNTSGAYQWHTFFGSASHDRSYGLAVDSSGNVYASGFSNATWNGPGGTPPLLGFAVSGSGQFVLKLNTSGAYQWHTLYGHPDFTLGSYTAVDSSGNVYVTGTSNAAWNGPGGAPPLHAFGSTGTPSLDLFVLKISDPSDQKIINDLVTFVPLTSTYRATADPTGCPSGFVGKFGFDARLTNKTSSPPISDLAMQVNTLTNGNLLQNADGGNGGVGATLTVPKKNGYSDGTLSHGESVDVHFSICLKDKKPFTFFVDVLGTR